MFRTTLLSAVALVGFTSQLFGSDIIRGTYVEARTCQVYTGPCFANGEVGSAGKNAVMTWRIIRGNYAGADLSGKSVAVIINASHTLGFHGLDDAATKKAIVIVDATADAEKAEALRAFAVAQTGLNDEQIASVDSAQIDHQFDFTELTAKVEVGDLIRLDTRKARKGDCICSNESAYYPPLTSLSGFVPGVTIEGDVTAHSLGTRWSIPDTRTAYLGTFEIHTEAPKLANSL